MDEKSVLNLISQSVRHILREYGAGWNEKDEKAVSDRVADVAWNCLILGMREMLSEGSPAIFEELGRFQFAQDKWEFEPADSLLEAGALSMNHEEGNQLLAAHALFYISQATALIKRIPEDVIVPDESDVLSKLSVEERLARAIFKELEGTEYRVVLRQKLNAMFDAVAHLEYALARSGKAEMVESNASQARKTYAARAAELGKLAEELARSNGENSRVSDTQHAYQLGLQNLAKGIEK